MLSTLNVMKALADGNRLRTILALMDHDELCACQITELLQVSGATASRHLSILVNAGLLQSWKQGRWVYYRLAKDADAELLGWLRKQAKHSAEMTADQQALALIMQTTPEDICRKQRGETCCPQTPKNC